MMWIWIGLIITLILIELLTNKLITIWYVVSAVIAFILSLFINNYIIEFSIFAILGTILLFTIRDYFFNILNNKKKEIVMNNTGIVLEEIKKNKQGKIKIKGRKYNAISNKKLNKGDIVKVIEINDNILKVSKEKNEK